MSQFKHLATELGNATVGTVDEAKWAALLVQFILGSTKLREMPEQEFRVLVAGLLTVHNKQARSGLDRCDCGNKYWENDRCIDCRVEYDPEKFKEAV